MLCRWRVLQAGRPLNGTASCQWMLLDKQFVIALLLIQTLLDLLYPPGLTRLPWLFLQVDYSELQNSLTNLSIIVRGESVSRPLNVVQAANGKDAFVKVLVLIASLFKDWGCFLSFHPGWGALCDKHWPRGLLALAVLRYSLTAQ